MDARAMEFEDGSYDVAVDKGTLDAILCGSDSNINANLMLSECSRVMKNNSLFICITYGNYILLFIEKHIFSVSSY